ncbi:MAG: type II toxin-antitoxin system RelE/ParE family toxin [Pantoea sp.]|uniref:type II toxin-antitoxin system RelE/ParE family toxin n=1 Tax=Pantoea sp. TaxID=69393 RepID=UPI00238E9499|nr:type II toxin-antitoxin system RelE/ParE family toxin [Pantoea sp.]MDE1186702.1 type II toxin-antitoxin system RelE/ParE family toxin [Pantoea sp.]
MTLILSQEAQQDISDIRRYTVNKWGKAKAIEYILQLQLAMKTLERSPQLGIEREEIRADARSFPCGKHIIFYRVIPNGIAITAVLSQLQDPKRYL